MGEIRDCEQCGTAFAPRREHSRFCSARCRLAWNQEHTGDPSIAVDALDWSITAMAEATGRLARSRKLDLPRLAAAVREAVWWVTIVDATLVRYRPASYDRVLASQPGERRQRTEEMLAGLRFVRNQMGIHLDPVEFVRVGPGTWQWRPLPEPACVSLSQRAQHWELSRYEAYQCQLAGHEVVETFTVAVDFLTRAAALDT